MGSPSDASKMNTKRILLISAYLPGDGGIECVIKNLYPEFLKLGYELELCILSIPKFPDWYKGITARHYDIYLPYVRSFHLYTLIKMKSIVKILSVELSRAPDIIIFTHTFLGIPIFITKKLAYNNKPILFWPNCSLFSSGNMFKKLYTWINCSFTDACLAISSSIYAQLKSLFPQIIIELVYNPLNKSNDEIRLRSNSKTKKLIYMSRLEDKQKNISFLLNGLALITASGLDKWELSILGDGPSEKQLKNLASKLNLNNRILWHGYIQDPWKHINEADCLLLTSRNEGLPLVLGDAIQRGCPIISSDCAGTEDIVKDNINGWSYREGDMGSFISVMSAFLKEELYLDDYAAMLRSIDEFKPEKVAGRFVACFEAIKGRK